MWFFIIIIIYTLLFWNDIFWMFYMEKTYLFKKSERKVFSVCYLIIFYCSLTWWYFGCNAHRGQRSYPLQLQMPDSWFHSIPFLHSLIHTLMPPANSCAASSISVHLKTLLLLISKSFSFYLSYILQLYSFLNGIRHQFDPVECLNKVNHWIKLN